MGVGPKPAASLPGRVHRRECPRAPRGRVAAVAGAASVPSTLPTCLSVGWLQASGAELYWEKEFVPEAPSAPELVALGLVFLAPPGPGSLPSIPHWPFVAPQAAAALEAEHRAELARLLSSLEAKHREVGAGPGLRAEPELWV